MVTLGHYSLVIALLAAGWATVASFLAAITRGRGLQRSAERGIVASAGMVVVATTSLLYAFVTDNFAVDYVYFYSSTSQALQYKIGALWGGQAGSLLLWVLILCVMAVVMVWTNRNKNRTLMPVATSVVGLTITFFLILLNFIEPPFALGPPRTDGVGLNPQLKNYWMMIHPPCLYLGYVGFTIPFAFAISALATRRTGDVWFRTTRRWTLVSWFFLGIGVVLGGYWAYIELGWGGYWAWDPVENASLIPWLTGTAFLHSVMIQEKKGMLKVWNMTLIILTFLLAIFGTFLTRSGIISSVHAFATSDIGPAFGIFLAITFCGSVFLLIFRLEDLRSEAKLESLLSRESSFLFNNMVLVGIAATVLFLTTFPLISEAIRGRTVTMGPPIFNIVNIPWALFLLFLTGVGPLIAWRKASPDSLRRNFAVPLLVGAWVFMLVAFLDRASFWEGVRGFGASVASVDLAGAMGSLQAIYPALTFGIGAFVLATTVLEFRRGVRLRRSRHDESFPVALGRLVWRNKRRYGGYVVHVGMVVIFFGIAGSSAYRVEAVADLVPGQELEVAGFTVRYDGYRVEAVDDHIGSVVEVTVRDGDRVVGSVEAEQRYHPNLQYADLKAAFLHAKSLRERDPARHRQAVARLYPLIRELESRAGREVKTPSTEVGILSLLSPLRISRFGEDFYVIPLWVDPASGQASIRVFVNPMVNFIWFGAFIVVLGASVCVLPDPRERRRLQAALDREDRAVA